ncbi:MAG: dTMP kinase [Myxococcales bacterium]|nr:dTMP kinase [Myxococcales bacterium]
MSRRGRFIVLEGIDGAGTTTQAKAIARALRLRGHPVLVTQEPSRGPVGRLIRRALAHELSLPDDSLALLFAADRMEHLSREISPALSEGRWVICDRYALSSLAYQGAVLPVGWVEEINRRAARPDLTLFLDVSTRTAALRRAERGGAPELFDAARSQRRIAVAYLRAIRRRSRDERIARIDGELPASEVTRRALAILESSLGL